MPQTILIADDEVDVLNLVASNLRTAGFTVVKVENGPAVLEAVRGQVPDLIVLDLMLPGLTGLEVCKILKSTPATAGIPIIMLTAKAGEVDRIVGLELGADDYITKPFSPRELVLRLQSILRRSVPVPASPELPLVSGEISIDRARCEVTVRQKPVDLTATEFRLLTLLIERRGRVQTRDKLLTDVWGYESVIDTRTVDTHMRRLREKLGDSADCIETVRGFGYRIADDRP